MGVIDRLPSFVLATVAQVSSGALPWSTLNLAGQTDDPLGIGLQLWSAGTISIGRQGNNDSRFTTSGISTGGDYRVRENLILGIGLGFGREDQKIGNGESRNQGDSYSMVIYGSYQPEDGFFVDGLVGRNRAIFDTQRHVGTTGDTARSSRKGSQWFASLSSGYEYQEGGLMLSPYGRLDLISSLLDRSTESGAGIYNLAYFDQVNTTTKLSLGMRGEARYDLQNGTAKPFLRIEYQRDLAKPGSARIAYADQLGGTIYQFDMDNTDRNALVLGLGSDFTFLNGWGGGLSYRFSHGGSSSSQMHTFGAHINKLF